MNVIFFLCMLFTIKLFLCISQVCLKAMIRVQGPDRVGALTRATHHKAILEDILTLTLN